MPDLEKVIKALEYCTHSDDCLGCIHWQKVAKGERCTVREDALALLKEREAVEPFHKCIGNEFSLIEDSHFDYCPYCGKPVTWAKQEGR